MTAIKVKRNSGVKRACERERVTEFGSLIFFCGHNDKLQGFSDDNHVKLKKMVIKVLLKMNVASTAFIMGAAAAPTCMSVLLITRLRTTQLAVIDCVLA